MDEKQAMVFKTAFRYALVAERSRAENLARLYIDGWQRDRLLPRAEEVRMVADLLEVPDKVRSVGIQVSHACNKAVQGDEAPLRALVKEVLSLPALRPGVDQYTFFALSHAHSFFWARDKGIPCEDELYKMLNAAWLAARNVKLPPSMLERVAAVATEVEPLAKVAGVDIFQVWSYD